MNTIKKLTESISNFLIEIANHYEIPSSEIVSTLMEINFYSLFQTLCREAEPVYAFRSYGKDDCLLNYWGEKLFPCKAILLYRMPDHVADEGRIATMHFLEVWLREDLTLAVTDRPRCRISYLLCPGTIPKDQRPSHRESYGGYCGKPNTCIQYQGVSHGSTVQQRFYNRPSLLNALQLRKPTL